MELLEKYFAELIQCIDASYLVIGIIGSGAEVRG